LSEKKFELLKIIKFFPIFWSFFHHTNPILNHRFQENPNIHYISNRKGRGIFFFVGSCRIWLLRRQNQMQDVYHAYVGSSSETNTSVCCGGMTVENASWCVGGTIHSLTLATQTRFLNFGHPTHFLMSRALTPKIFIFFMCYKKKKKKKIHALNFIFSLYTTSKKIKITKAGCIWHMSGGKKNQNYETVKDFVKRNLLKFTFVFARLKKKWKLQNWAAYDILSKIHILKILTSQKKWKSASAKIKDTFWFLPYKSYVK